MPDHLKGLLITMAGVLVLTPDTLLIRLIALDTGSLLFWRGLLMALVLGVWVLVRYGRSLPEVCRALGRSGLVVMVLSAANTILFVMSVNHTSVANTLIIIASSPLFSALFSRFLLGETIRLRTWIAIVCGIGGVAVTVSADLGSRSTFGDLCALAVAICAGATFVAIRKARGATMLPALAGSGVLVTPIVLPFATPLAVTGRDLVLVPLLCAVVLPLSLALIMIGPRYIPAPEVSLLLLLETVIGPLWVWAAIGEQPSPEAFVGGAILVGTLAVHAALGLREVRQT